MDFFTFLGIFAAFIIAVCVVVGIASRSISWYLSKLLQQRFGIKLKIGRFGFFSIQEVRLQFRDGTTLEVEKAWLTSNLFSTKYSSLIVICLGEVRLQVHFDKLLENKPPDRGPPDKKPREFKLQLSRKARALFKRLSVHVCNASVMQLGAPSQDCLLHATLQEIAFHVLARDAEFYVSLNIFSAAVKIFKHPQDTSHNDSCLADFCVTVQGSAVVSAKDISVAHNITLNIAQPEIVLYEDRLIEALSSSEPTGNQAVPSTPEEEPSKDESESAALDDMDSERAELKALVAKMPEAVYVKMESASVKVLRDNWNKGLFLEVHSFTAELLQDSSQSCFATCLLALSNLALTSDQFQLAALAKAEATGKLHHEQVDVNVKLAALRTAYSEDELRHWAQLLPASPRPPVERKRASKTLTQRLSSLKMLVRASAELEDVSVSVITADCEPLSAGLQRARLNADVGSLLLSGKDQGALPEMSSEVMLEMAWCTLGSCDALKPQQLKKSHFWNVPFSIGMMLLKTRHTSSDLRVQCMLGSVHSEVNPRVSGLVAHWSSKVAAKAALRRPEQKPALMHAQQAGPALSLHLSLSDTNVFGLSSAETGVVLRVDSLNVDCTSAKAYVNLEGCALAALCNTVQSYSCIPASEMRSPATYLKSARLNYKPEQREVQLQLLDEVSVSWNTTLHMSLFTLAQDLKELKSSLKFESQPLEETVREEAAPTEPLSFNICLQGMNNFEFRLSKAHRIKFFMSDLHIKSKPARRSITTEALVVHFDEHQVFTFQQVQYASVPSDEKSSINRHTIKGLTQQYNKLWTLSIEEMRVVFPYGYNFAEAFSEEAVNIIRWLKLIHKRSKVPFTADSPLPSDFSIKAKTLTIELGDDPFEVKLRNNYELLEDEYHESLKRKRMLDEKIENYRKTHLLLPASKVNELYASLRKKDADIYVQRSKQLGQGPSPRSHLAVWHFDQVEVLALADPSFHGTEAVVEVMQRLDPESAYPEEGMQFSTLWCRRVTGSAKSITCQLRDFPQFVVDWRDFQVWGTLAGAEQEAPPRAKRSSTVEVGAPWGNMTVERSMPSLKFYHDLTWDLGYLGLTYGACWEPVMAQVSLCMEQVSRPSADPSPVLAWWDKARLLLHGRLTVSARHLALFQHVSLDPYNDSELFEVSWSDAIVDWTNGKIVMKGNLGMYVHTASRYNDSRVLHIPNLKISIKMNWLCIGNPFDHHSIVPCAPDKIPEYSSNQEHDSYRAFRSQNLNLSVSLETKAVALETADSIPTFLVYSSTLKWMEGLKAIVSGLPKLTRRGALFGNVKPRKSQLTRHVRQLQLSLSLHKFQVCYWASLGRQHGFELLAGRLQLSSEHSLALDTLRDGLLHRPRANWSVSYMNCELGDSEVWLYNASTEGTLGEHPPTPDVGAEPQAGLTPTDEDSGERLSPQAPLPPQRKYFLSVARVSYGRETKVRGSIPSADEEDTPVHLLVVHGLKGAWTKHNRDVVFGLFDSYVDAKLLRRNLSTEALRGFRVDTQPMTSPELRPSPRPTRKSTSPAVSMLQQLESGPKTVYTEDVEGVAEEEQLHGVAACQADDVLHKNWSVELINSQVMLRGCETSGYVIVSAAKAEILQRVHTPVWKENTLVSKTTWTGSLECMQYYATVDAGERGASDDGVVWLTVDNIEERAWTVIEAPADLVGSGQGVGGVVSNTVGGASDPNTAPLQLQRIISRCGCQFFYASYGENIDPEGLEEVPPLPEEEEEELWGREQAVDAFTLTHHDLEVCSNPLQYAMVLDLVNNLLLYVEPRRREANERLQRMRFRLQLSAGEDHRTPILQLQGQVRSLLSMHKQLEREAYQVQRGLNEDPTSADLETELAHLEDEIRLCKEQLSASSKELALMLSCYRETQVAALKSRQRAAAPGQEVAVVRRAEVCFKHARWRLTDVDGQLGIADLILANFLYSRVTKSNDSVEHLLELGNVKVTNLLPNQAYKEVLQPTELQPHVPLERQRALRIFCRVRAPVGGISVKEHLEVNLVPITIGLTHAFTYRMLRFFFSSRTGRDAPDKTDDHLDEEPKPAPPPASHTRRGRRSQPSLASSSRDDVEKMKERAEKNQTFVYVKVPEVPLRLSYKGEKEKNLEDLHDCSLVLPTLELHNRTCTWLDLLMVVKSTTRKVLLSQAIKQKLQIKSHQTQGSAQDDANQPQEEDKARLLLGAKLLGGPEKSSRRGFFK